MYAYERERVYLVFVPERRNVLSMDEMMTSSRQHTHGIAPRHSTANNGGSNIQPHPNPIIITDYTWHDGRTETPLRMYMFPRLHIGRTPSKTQVLSSVPSRQAQKAAEHKRNTPSRAECMGPNMHTPSQSPLTYLNAPPRKSTQHWTECIAQHAHRRPPNI